MIDPGLSPGSSDRKCVKPRKGERTRFADSGNVLSPFQGSHSSEGSIPRVPAPLQGLVTLGYDAFAPVGLTRITLSRRMVHDLSKLNDFEIYPCERK